MTKNIPNNAIFHLPLGIATIVKPFSKVCHTRDGDKAYHNTSVLIFRGNVSPALVMNYTDEPIVSGDEYDDFIFPLGEDRIPPKSIRCVVVKKAGLEWRIMKRLH